VETQTRTSSTFTGRESGFLNPTRFSAGHHFIHRRTKARSRQNVNARCRVVFRCVFVAVKRCVIAMYCKFRAVAVSTERGCGVAPLTLISWDVILGA